MIENLLLAKIKPRAVIFCEKKFSTIDLDINQYIKSIVCEKVPYCNNCENCKKIDNNSYRDLIIYDGSKQTIKKEDVAFIQNQFLYAPFEKNGKKIYILKNVDNSTPEAMNSLLKFIEEPPKETYAILTTRNISKVIPTIKSRCQIFHLCSNIKDFENKINDFKLTQKQKDVLLKTYFSFYEFKQDYDTGAFTSSFNFVNNLISKHDDLKTIKELSNEFVKFDYTEIKKILQFASVMFENKKKEIILMINELKFYPAKILIFNKLWEMLNE